jgi:4-hydroxybenzoate polyprenyltransferase
MKPIEVISHIVLSISLIASIVMGVYGLSEHGIAPFWVLLVFGGSFVLGFQLMLIITGE